MEVWPVDTVQFSNHPGYGAPHRPGLHRRHVRDVVDGIAARGVLGQCAAVLSGYLGDPAVGEAVLHAVAAVRGPTRRAVLLRPGDRRRRPGHLRAGRHPRPAARPLPAAGRHRHPQPVRAGAADRPHRPHAARTPRPRRRLRATHAARRLRSGDQPGRRRHAGRLDRPAGGGGRRGLAAAHPAAADRSQRHGGHHRRTVPAPPAAHRQHAGRAVGRRQRRVRPAAAHAGSRLPRAADGGGAGGVRASRARCSRAEAV